MAFEKPMSENQKENGNKLYRFMKHNDFVTKEQMLAHLGWDKTRDRQLRDLISMIAKKVPVISTSDSKGYKIAQDKADLELVEHAWAELSSRIEELNKRIMPLMEFREKVKFWENENGTRIMGTTTNAEFTITSQNNNDTSKNN